MHRPPPPGTQRCFASLKRQQGTYREVGVERLFKRGGQSQRVRKGARTGARGLQSTYLNLANTLRCGGGSVLRKLWASSSYPTQCLILCSGSVCPGCKGVVETSTPLMCQGKWQGFLAQAEPRLIASLGILQTRLESLHLESLGQSPIKAI